MRGSWASTANSARTRRSSSAIATSLSRRSVFTGGPGPVLAYHFLATLITLLPPLLTLRNRPMTSDSVAVALSRSEAILAVADMAATVRFYRDKLSFTGDWLWGDPPTFGGVSWGRIG